MTISSRPFRISQPSERDPRDDIAIVCEVFDLKPTSEFLAKLSRTPVKTLHRAWKGSPVRPRDHLQVVADFAREVRDHMFADPTWTTKRARAMRRWLEEGEIEMDGVIRRPVDVLSDDLLARRALAELESATR